MQAISGFAGTMLAMPAAIMLIGMADAKVILNVAAIAVCAGVAVKERHHINLPVFKKIMVGMTCGMAVGICLLGVINTAILLNLYGVLIIFIALKKLLVKRERTISGPGQFLIIFAAGLIHGLFISGGSLLVIYAVSVMKDKHECRATLSIIWVVLNGVLFLRDLWYGYFTSSVLTLTIVSVLAAAVSIWAGNWLHNKINQNMFLKITYGLLLLSGVMLIF